MVKPNFFIIGAPKCGTTSLASWLAQHREVYMSPKKEPHFFNTDMTHRDITREEEYLRLFEARKSREKSIGEASVFYLYSQVAVTNILKNIRNPKFIVCLRDPVQMVISYHFQLVYTMHQLEKDITRAWEAGMNPRRCATVLDEEVDVSILRYSEVCSLGKQVRRLYEHVPKECVKLVFLDDLRDRPEIAFREVLDFLGLDNDPNIKFSAKNQAKKARSESFQKLIRKIAKIKKNLNIPDFNSGLLDWLVKLNQVKAIPSVDKKFEEGVLRPFFMKDIELLEELAARNLSAWKR